MSDTKYPNCEKLSQHRQEWEAINAFVDWLGDHEIFLASWSRFQGEDVGMPVGRSPARLFEDYLGIDQNELEQERRAILDEARRASEDQKP